MRFTFDPVKDQANRLKHGLSLADAPWVFDSPDKLTLESPLVLRFTKPLT
jgi:uncharacterized DUF497 family protein